MNAGPKIAEKLKAELLDDLRLMKPADWNAYWQQARWPKPNPAALANSPIVVREDSGKRAGIFAPIRFALARLEPELIVAASAQLDPFGWLLENVNVTEWSTFCRVRRVPWMTRVWQAAASQLRVELRFVFKAHGWSDTWKKLRRNQHDMRAADAFFCAQLSHAREQRQTELLAVPALKPRLAKARAENDEAFLRRFRRAKNGSHDQADVSLAEKFMVQHWLELPHGFPGLCFFSDTALHSFLVILGLHRSEAEVHITTLLRGRIGLIQAGAKQHLIEHVETSTSKLQFRGRMVKTPYILNGQIAWDGRRLWPR